MIVVSVKAPSPPAKCLCAVAETALPGEPVVVVKPPDAEARQSVLEVSRVEVKPAPDATVALSILEVGGIGAKPADARSDISISVSVSVTVS